MEEREENKQKAHEEEMRAQEAQDEEERKPQEAREDEERRVRTRLERRRSERKKQEEKEAKAQEERREEERKVQAQEWHEGKEEMTTQGECVEEKKETNSVQEEHDVSNRHVTWWIRVDSGPHLQTARGRRAAEQARVDGRVEESRSVAEEAEGEKWGRKKLEQRRTRRKENNTLHIVFHFPTASTTTATTATTKSNRNNSSSSKSSCSRSDAASVMTTTGAFQLKELVTKDELFFPDIVANGILNAFVQGKSTGKSNQNTISDEKGHLSQDSMRTCRMHPVFGKASDP